MQVYSFLPFHLFNYFSFHLQTPVCPASTSPTPISPIPTHHLLLGVLSPPLRSQQNRRRSFRTISREIVSSKSAWTIKRVLGQSGNRRPCHIKRRNKNYTKMLSLCWLRVLLACSLCRYALIHKLSASDPEKASYVQHPGNTELSLWFLQFWRMSFIFRFPTAHSHFDSFCFYSDYWSTAIPSRCLAPRLSICGLLLFITASSYWWNYQH